MSRRDSTVSIAEMLALPSVPLKPVGDPGPPRIIECQDNYNAIEGLQPPHSKSKCNQFPENPYLSQFYCDFNMILTARRIM